MRGDLRLYLTKMSPNIPKLCEGRQALLSHQIGDHGMYYRTGGNTVLHWWDFGRNGTAWRFFSTGVRNLGYMQGRRQRGSSDAPPSHLKSVPSISCLARRLLHTSNTVFLKCGPPSGFWPLHLVFGPPCCYILATGLGTCTPRSTFAYLKGYIYCTAATNYLLEIKTESTFIVLKIKMLIFFDISIWGAWSFVWGAKPTKHENVYIRKNCKNARITSIWRRASQLHERAMNSKKRSQCHVFFRRM